MKSNNYLTVEKVYLPSKLYRCISRVSICSELNTFCTYFKFWYFHIKAMLPKKQYLPWMFLFLPFNCKIFIGLHFPYWEGLYNHKSHVHNLFPSTYNLPVLHLETVFYLAQVDSEPLIWNGENSTLTVFPVCMTIYIIEYGASPEET